MAIDLQNFGKWADTTTTTALAGLVTWESRDPITVARSTKLFSGMSLDQLRQLNIDQKINTLFEQGRSMVGAKDIGLPKVKFPWSFADQTEYGPRIQRLLTPSVARAIPSALSKTAPCMVISTAVRAMISGISFANGNLSAKEAVADFVSGSVIDAASIYAGLFAGETVGLWAGARLGAAIGGIAGPGGVVVGAVAGAAIGELVTSTVVTGVLCYVGHSLKEAVQNNRRTDY